ncbi:MAG TPA: hypothetical protein VKB93_04160 [Thermoanaerobaculia bacterium]|nr:hypothetical protein [Thermoanaerobaculia bacterium]
MSKASDLEQAQSLVRDVILGQNNLYIKELLREKKVPVKANATKAELAALLTTAVDDGTITLAKLTDWIDETEGWGDEHIYLFNVPKSVCNDALWTRSEHVQEHVRGVKKLAKLWDADTSVEYPEERMLTGIHYDDSERELTCVWHQGTRFRQRAKEKDFERDEEDGEHYYYDAYRDAARRNVARIVFRPRAALAAVFLPGASEPKSHGPERESMVNEISDVFRIDDKRICSMADAIKALDAQANTNAGARKVQARSTRLNTTDGGAYVEFASDSKLGYAGFDPVRKVRKAVSSDEFVGGGATFHFTLPPIADKERDARVNLYGDFQRIRMWVHLTRADVWAILGTIRSALP